MIIGIIAAMEPEITNTISALTNRKEHLINNVTFYEGEIGNHKVVVSQSGIGKVNSAINTTLLINNFNPDVIINSGIAGGSKELSTFDFVIADKLTYSDFDCQVFNYTFGQVPQMPVYYYSDPTLKEKIESLGGKVTGSVTGKTFALINNDATSNSSKNKKARELGVQILTESEFLQQYVNR